MNKISEKPASQFSIDPGQSYTLPADLYTSKDTLQQEHESIFMRSWLYVAHGSELAEPGQYVTAEFLDQRIYVIRTEGGELKAFHNVCQHRGHSLLRGKGTARRLIMCPYHAWSYDHDGTLRAAPNCAHVEGFERQAFNLPQIRIDTLAGFVFVNFDPDARPMAEVYPGASEAVEKFCETPETLTTTQDVVFDIAGNWKNVGDNLLECYHCATAHKAFVDLVEMKTYQVETHDQWSVQWGDCRCENDAYDYDEASGDTQFCTLFLWPTTAIGKFPGTRGLITFTFVPIAPEETHQVFAYHGSEKTLNDSETRAIEYFQDVLGPEDVSLIEDVQKGLHSRGYHQGRIMVDQSRSEVSEHALHHFQALVAKSLGLI